MNFPNNINPEPGYYNITGPLITNPIPIDLNNNNIDDFELGLYLNNSYLNNQGINNFLPFPINLSEIIYLDRLFDFGELENSFINPLIITFQADIKSLDQQFFPKIPL
jgi:hypothetical protein